MHRHALLGLEDAVVLFVDSDRVLEHFPEGFPVGGVIDLDLLLGVVQVNHVPQLAELDFQLLQQLGVCVPIPHHPIADGTALLEGGSRADVQLGFAVHSRNPVGVIGPLRVLESGVGLRIAFPHVVRDKVQPVGPCTLDLKELDPLG